MDEINNVMDIENLIADKIDELKYIDGINGNKRLVTDVVKDIHKNTGWLTKPKLLIGIIIFVVSQAFVFGVWKGTIEERFDNIEANAVERYKSLKEDMHTNQEDIKELLKEK